MTVQFSCADTLSGIPQGARPADQTLNDEGTSISSSAQSVSDAAGNTSAPSNLATAAIDRTAPTISAAATTAPNAAGWYNGPVTVQFSCADALSGASSAGCQPDHQHWKGPINRRAAPAPTTPEIARPSTQPGINIDTTAPTLGPEHQLRARCGWAAWPRPARTPVMRSRGSPAQSCGALDTSSLGVKSVSCTATDQAGNSASISISYTVLAPGCEGLSATIYINLQGRIVGGKDNGKVYTGKLNGTTGNDVIVGTAGKDEVDAKAGNDRRLRAGRQRHADRRRRQRHRSTAARATTPSRAAPAWIRCTARAATTTSTATAAAIRSTAAPAPTTLDGDGGNDTLTGGANADHFKGGSGTDTATDFTPAQGDTRSSVERPLVKC